LSQPAVAGSSRAGAILQWILVALLIDYTALVHWGIGPPPGGLASNWWEPRAFLITWSPLSPLLQSPARAMVGLGLPAVLLAAGVFLAGRSSVARALALSAVYATVLFVFYGIQAPGAWEFFHWRGSAVMAVLSLCLGFSTAAPFLAKSWLRFGWAVRLLLYLPVALGVITFLRNATGTDQKLRYAISPWPAVPVFGMEVGSLFVFTGLLGVALAIAGIARARAGRIPPVAGALAVPVGLAVPVCILALGSAFSLLPFRLGLRVAIAVATVCALSMAFAAIVRPRDAEALRNRARGLAVGALLIGIPLLAGQAWARWDYYVTREHRARELIDALQAYYAQEELYPDELGELVPAFLGEIPEPSIGFDFLYDGRFRYRSFGTNFLLEFPAPRWVECAYSPPYEDEDEEGDDPDDGAAEDRGESWSCPSRPPELW
jgi:hypothetical protein